MLLDNFCCIGAELQNREVSQYKAPQLFYYRSANSSETMSAMLTAGFFNSIYQRVKVGDLVFVYEPMTKQIQYIKITSNIGGVVGFEKVAQGTITAAEVPVVPLSPFVSTNLQDMSDEVITKIGQMEIDIAGKVSANNSVLTGTTTINSADIGATDTDTLTVNTSATINDATLTGSTSTNSISATGDLSVSGSTSTGSLTVSTSATVPAPTSDNNPATKKYVDDAVAGSTAGYHPDLFAHEWDDKLRDNVSWLRGDTFSWQSGKVYQAAIKHLLKDILMDRFYIMPIGGLSTKFYRSPENDTATQFAWTQGFSILYTDNEFPENGDDIYYQGSVVDTVDVFSTSTSSYLTVTGDTKKYYRDVSLDESTYYAWVYNTSEVYYTTSDTPENLDDAYTKSGGVFTVTSSVDTVALPPTAQTETIEGNTITYYVGADTHKIVLSDQESTVLDIYNACGVAWYYIVDYTNIRFKLPRKNPTREDLITIMRAKGNGKTLGLTNGTNYYGLINGSTTGLNMYSGAYGGTAGSAGSSADATGGNMQYGITTDHTKSGIVIDPTNSDTVFAGSKYLYFYVGNFTQTAVENTAGLNASLFNGKVDTDLDNMNPSATAKATIIGWGIPDYTTKTSITLPYTATESCLYSFEWGTYSRGTILINGIEVCHKIGASNDDNYGTQQFLMIGTGDVITTTGTAPTDNYIYKLKGNN